jgi:CDGSH-type Zn-finger protein
MLIRARIQARIVQDDREESREQRELRTHSRFFACIRGSSENKKPAFLGGL